MGGHPVVAEGDQADGHGVLGQVRVGEFVDRVGLPVAPVLQEFGGGAGVIDLVEVHPVRLCQPKGSQRQGGHDDDHQQPQVESIEPPAGLAVEPPRAIRPECPHGQPRGQPAQAGTVVRRARQLAPGPRCLASIARRRGLPAQLTGIVRPFPLGVDQGLRVQLPDGPGPELRERPQEDRQVHQGQDRDPARRAQLRGQPQPVLHSGVLVERVEQDRVQVGEGGDRQRQVGDPPAQGGRGEDRPQGKGREHVALVDPGRHDEERDGQHGQRDEQRAPIVAQRPERPRIIGILHGDRLDAAAPPRHDETDQHDDQQQQRGADVDGRDAGDEGGDLVRLGADRVAWPRAVGRQAVAVVLHERPRVVGIDGQIRIAAGRLDHLLEQADQRQPERQAQHDRGAKRNGGTRDQAHGTATKPIEPAVRTRPRWRAQLD